MNIRTRSLLLSISVLASLLGFFGGGVSGYYIYDYFISHWRYIEIVSFPSATDIVQVDFYSSGEDPTGDTVYLTSADGYEYANTLFQDRWVNVETISEISYEAPLCATDWEERPPPIDGILDSAGAKFERPLSTLERCYILFDDGSLQVWSRWHDAPSMLVTIITCSILGLLTSILLSLVCWRKARKSRSR